MYLPSLWSTAWPLLSTLYNNAPARCLNCALGKSRQFVSKWGSSVLWVRSRAGPLLGWTWSWVVVAVWRETASLLGQPSCADCRHILRALSSIGPFLVDGGDGKKVELAIWYCWKPRRTHVRRSRIRRMHFWHCRSQLVIMSLLSLHLLGSALSLHPHRQRHSWGDKMMMPLGRIPYCRDFAFRCDPLLAYWLVTDNLVVDLCCWN